MIAQLILHMIYFLHSQRRIQNSVRIYLILCMSTYILHFEHVRDMQLQNTNYTQTHTVILLLTYCYEIQFKSHKQQLLVKLLVKINHII